MRIIWNSNSIWTPSGYGQQAAEIVPRIKQAGYDIACIDFYGLEGGIITDKEGIVHYPKMAHVYGSDAMIHHARDFGADITISFMDVWVLHPQDIAQYTRWIPYVPIDHAPVPPAVLEKLKMAYRIITYSQFGQRELAKQGLHSIMIPHGVDTNIFKPSDIPKAELKKQAGIDPECFVMGMVGANKDNPPRKSFQEVLDAFAMFVKKHPNSKLYIHTDPNNPSGFPIPHYAQSLGIADKVIFPNLYDITYKIQKADMAQIYNSLDVLLMPSTNEGFGIPAIEAQACGIPVIVNDGTSMPELVKDGITGKICKVLYRRFDQLHSYVDIPDTNSIHNCMIDIFRADRLKMGEEARKFMIEKHDSKMIFDTKWLLLLKKLETEIQK